MTGPKPFPFPIGIGTDVCQINRIAAILRDEHRRNRWARKIFTRLEWPALCQRMRRAAEATGEPVGQADAVREEKEGNLSRFARYYDNTKWMLPGLPQYSSISGDETSCWSDIASERSALGGLARYLAGRWAAKEAVIKAHRHRRLYMQDISIVGPSLPPDSSCSTGSDKMVALIDPPGDRIEMYSSVATRRGLRGFVFKNYGLYKGALLTRDELPQAQESGEGMVDLHKGVHYYRRSRVKESDRQVAEINISHDGDYAIAVCMAFDPQDSIVQEKRIVDCGEGLPLHEPQWGDEGWPDLVTSGIEEESFGAEDDSALDMPLEMLLGKPQPTPNPDAFKKGFKRIFENENVPPLP